MLRYLVLASLLLLSKGSDIKGKTREGPKTRWFEGQQLKTQELDEEILSPAQKPVFERKRDESDALAPPRWPKPVAPVAERWAKIPETSRISSPVVWEAPEAVSSGFIEPPPAVVPEPASMVAANYRPASPYSFGYLAELEDRGTSSRSEESNGQRVQGKYAMSSADGISRTVYYVADQDGFRAHIVTNEPGTESKNPSGIMMKSSQLPAEEITWQAEPARLKTVTSTSNFVHSPLVYESAADTKTEFRAPRPFLPVAQFREGKVSRPREEFRAPEAPIKGQMRRIAKVTKVHAPVKGEIKRPVVQQKFFEEKRILHQKPVEQKFFEQKRTFEEKPVEKLRLIEPVAYRVEIERPTIIEHKTFAPTKTNFSPPTKVNIPKPILPRLSPVKGDFVQQRKVETKGKTSFPVKSSFKAPVVQQRTVEQKEIVEEKFRPIQPFSWKVEFESPKEIVKKVEQAPFVEESPRVVQEQIRFIEPEPVQFKQEQQQRF